jgi:NTE family protein
MKALVLSGGGARGAYQVGVLTAIAEIAQRTKIRTPFKIYTGVSAGAINAAFLATGADEFSLTVGRLSKLWSQLTSEQIFLTDAATLGKIGLQWMGELSFGAIKGTSPSRALLDTQPLWGLLRDNLEFSKIQKHIDEGDLYSVALTALDYRTSTAITFVQGNPQLKMWERTRRHAERTHIKAEHVMASSAIPLLFPPIQMEDRWFGDGCIRNTTPLSAALHMGATDLFVIGVRKQDNSLDDLRLKNTRSNPSVARVMNVLLNSVMLDGVEVDIERLNRINEFLNRVPPEHQDKLNFTRVESVWIHPTEDIGAIASQMASRLPRLIRYLLKGLGPLDDAAEIISYLMFEPEFCTKLIEIGYQDGMKQKDNIEAFLLKN